MKTVLERVSRLAEQFSELTYFALLEQAGTWSDVEIMGPGLSFFVLSFQDMLRLNATLITEPVLAAIARRQREDDAGHDAWFLHDLEQLKIEPDLRWLFGKKHQQTRDTSYEIIAQLIRAPNDPARLAVGLALEATGGVYFSRAYRFFERLGIGDGLRFFSKQHWDVERSHDLYEAGVQERLQAVVLSDAEREQAIEAAAQTFGSVRRMCEDLSCRMLAAREPREVVAGRTTSGGTGRPSVAQRDALGD